jgi:hypothetical protein
VPRLALLASLAWTVIVVYEVESKGNTETFSPGPGRFYELYTIFSISMFGVVFFAGLAWLVLVSVPAPATPPPAPQLSPPGD